MDDSFRIELRTVYRLNTVCFCSNAVSNSLSSPSHQWIAIPLYVFSRTPVPSRTLSLIFHLHSSPSRSKYLALILMQTLSAQAHYSLVSAFPPPAQTSPTFPPPKYNYPPPPTHQKSPSNGGYPPPSASPPAAETPPSRSSINAGAVAANSAVSASYAPSVSPPVSPPPAGKLEQIPGGAPPFGQFVGATATNQDDVGTFNGGSYRISHRDTNSLLTIQLAMGCPLAVKPGETPSLRISG